jgi:hypothetical protein
MIRRIIGAVLSAALIASLGASAVFAGEITGNGKSLHLPGGGLHGRSDCAFSGQEDLQFEDELGNPLPADQITKGVPAHAQSWGQIPKGGEFGRDFLTSIGSNPGIACNPTKSSGEPQ